MSIPAMEAFTPFEEEIRSAAVSRTGAQRRLLSISLGAPLSRMNVRSRPSSSAVAVSRFPSRRTGISSCRAAGLANVPPLSPSVLTRIGSNSSRFRRPSPSKRKVASFRPSRPA